MNWMLAAALASPFITLLGVAFITGVYKQKVEDLDERVDGHDAQFERHDMKFEKQDGRISEAELVIEGLKQWRDGYNAAVSKHGNRT